MKLIKLSNVTAILLDLELSLSNWDANKMSLNGEHHCKYVFCYT